MHFGRAIPLVLSLLMLLLISLATISAAQTPAFTPRDETPEDYPPGTGRDDTFFACTPCHGFKIVAQQGQTRRQWDDTLDWMTKRYAMPAPSADDRKIILEYLETAFPPRTRPRGWQNPFAK